MSATNSRARTSSSLPPSPIPFPPAATSPSPTPLHDQHHNNNTNATTNKNTINHNSTHGITAYSRPSTARERSQGGGGGVGGAMDHSHTSLNRLGSVLADLSNSNNNPSNGGGSHRLLQAGSAGVDTAAPSPVGPQSHNPHPHLPQHNPPHSHYSRDQQSGRTTATAMSRSDDDSATPLQQSHLYAIHTAMGSRVQSTLRGAGVGGGDAPSLCPQPSAGVPSLGAHHSVSPHHPHRPSSPPPFAADKNTINHNCDAMGNAPCIAMPITKTNAVNGKMDSAFNTLEEGGADCIVLVQQAFIKTLWAPSRQVVEDCRDRDLWGILKPLEVHLRVTVNEQFFSPLKAMLVTTEGQRRAHIAAMEEEKRLLLAELEAHLRCVALPTYRRLVEGTAQIEAVRKEFKSVCRLTANATVVGGGTATPVAAARSE